MIRNGEVTRIRLTNMWPNEIALEVGLIGVAFAQLTREVYLAARRQGKVPLRRWEMDNPQDNFSLWCRRL